MLFGVMPIRKALAALLFSSLLLCLAPSTLGAAPDRADRPSAALVASSETRLRSGGAAEGFSRLGLAALVAAGWIPALVLLTRKRRQRSAE
jgi:hypothetical protein